MSRAVAARRQNGLLDNILTIVYAGLIALGVRSILVEPFNIPSGSMIPTLQVGDFLFVSKFSYGYSRFSFPFAPPIFGGGRIFGRLPHRGDVAVFRQPVDTSVDFIKRIVGLPGDHIQVKEGLLYVNGVEAVRKLIGPYVARGDGPSMEVQRYTETLPNGVQHSILKATDDGPMNNTQEFVVPPGHLFAMGDNRDDSADSRFMDVVGYVPVENLIGRAEFIFLSFQFDHPGWEFWYWPVELRWSRLLTGVH